MEDYKVNLTSLRVIICNRPWYCLAKPLSIICISSWYIYWEIPIVYLCTFLPKYGFISVDVNILTSFTTNWRVCYFNLYAPNISDPILTSLCLEVDPLTKLHSISIPTGSFIVSIKFSFNLYFPLLCKFRVVTVYHLFLRFFMLRITFIIAFYELFLELFDGAKIFLPLVS